MGNYMKINIKIFCVLTMILSAFVTPVKAEGARITVAQAFYELARQNSPEKIMNLLNRGYSIESVDGRGLNPVCLAVTKQNRSAYNLLVRYGAKPKPDCLNKIPQSTYKQFFGTYRPEQKAAYVSDTPYTIGAVALGSGAIAAAYILRGDDGGDSGGGGGGGGDTCDHGTYDKETETCECYPGYGNYGDKSKCYREVDNCQIQIKDKCSACNSGYSLKDNVCYPGIPNCKVQKGDVCTECYSGYGIHGGDGTICYTDIPNCKVQETSTCKECVSGYGTHGGEDQCYKDIPHCLNQSLDKCVQCYPGYSTYGDPNKNVCYHENPCAMYDNTVPVTIGDKVECRCDEDRGYIGEPGSCTQTDEGNYQEGDGNRDEWNNLNELYCHSHGKYTIGIGCQCYRGYTSSDCSQCREGYIEQKGLCYADLNCQNRGEGYIQDGNRCVCDSGYYEYQGTCAAVAQCPSHYEQYAPGPDPDKACRCKANFDENCVSCVSGYVYDAENDSCVQTALKCEDLKPGEKWVGPRCDKCPAQYEITYKEDGTAVCGNKCAENRAPIDQNPTCESCASGYEYDNIDTTCKPNQCTAGVDGWIIDDTGRCVCDEANGYVLSPLGKCVLKGPDIIGIKNSNINNSIIDVSSETCERGFCDIYGMKPTEDVEGNPQEYDVVYNAMSSSGTEQGIINILNDNMTGNKVYGIYSPSTLYNAAAVMGSGAGSGNISAEGTINIIENASTSEIYGLYTDSGDNIYNAYAGNSAAGLASEPNSSSASALIKINKDKYSVGKAIGAQGRGNITNSYAKTFYGTAANTSAEATIEIENKGSGEVIGISGSNPTSKINNSLAYLDSAVSDAISTGNIIVVGNDNTYGIKADGTIANSETQFDKSYNKIGEFKSEGNIEVTTHSDLHNAYGIYMYNTGNQKAEIYNAIGYMSTGNITVTNDRGGSAYGILSELEIYQSEEEGHPKLYNNIYNAFRSSAKYGGDNAAAEGNITLNILGNSNSIQYGIGIYGVGLLSGSDIFNAFANSGSSVKLESVGNININDESTTAAMVIKGIESGGGKTANAYATGQNENTATSVIGNINIDITGSKSGSTIGQAYGMYNAKSSEMVAQVYNAALVDDISSAEGNIKISATGAASPGHIYGIYASKYDVSSETPDKGQEKIVYNAYYNNNDSGEARGKVRGNIEIISPNRSSGSHAEYYGIYVNEGIAYNAYTTNTHSDVVGQIKLDVGGGGNSGVAAGIAGFKSALYNSGTNSLIDVKTSREGSHAYGMKGDDSYLENAATINATSAKGNAYGLYVNKGQAVNNSNGVLNISGKKESYGIYVIADGTETGAAQAINVGTINLNGDGKNVGIYASGSNATVRNSGTINIKGSSVENVCESGDCDAAAIQLANGAKVVNSGTMSSTGDINLTAMGGSVILDTNGQFKAENEIKGELEVASSTVTDTFDEKTILSQALTAASVEDLAVKSNSYLYDAEIESKSDGTYDIVMDKKEFSEITDDKREAQYLTTNYENQRNIELFNALKSASTAEQENKIKSDVMGTSMIPNIAEEELKIQRNLNQKMTDELFKDGGDVKKMIGGEGLYAGRDDHDNLTGYDVYSQSMYALYDKKMDNHYRLGLGMSFTHTNTDYNNDSSRKNFLVQGYVPLTYKNNNGITAISMAQIGYADGEYKRHGYNHTYKADTQAITYGLVNEARYKKDFAQFSVTPFIGLNAIGWYQDDIDEKGNDALALHLDSSNIFSLESALGIYVDKEVEFSVDSKLDMVLGLGYYHEFADPYRGFDAYHGDNMLGTYRLRNKINSRDRGVLSAKVNYDYKDFSIYGEIAQYIEEENPIEIEGGLKYRF